MFNIVEFFSGIGSQAKALKNLGEKVNTIGTCEWDVHAIVAYDLIHNQDAVELPNDIQAMTKEEILDELKQYTFSNTGKKGLEYSAIKTYSIEALRRLYYSVLRNHNYVDISSLNGAEMQEGIDILTYSFPCQDLSNVGAFHGYNKGIDKDSGSRSSLLWQVGRILTEMKECGKSLPRFLLMENVPTLLSERHFTNFSTWICDLKSLGYVSKYYQLNASDFGLPQNRPRLLMVSVFVGDDQEQTQLVLDYFRMKNESAIIQEYIESKFFKQITVPELLRTNYSNQELFEEAVESTPNDTVSRRKIWEENPQIILPDNSYNPMVSAVRTLTTKQDRNPNSGNLYFESGIEGRGKFRYLTPRECMLFMGFTDADYDVLKCNNLQFHKGDSLFARDKVIRMAGNSIPVKLLEGVFLQIIRLDKVLREHTMLEKVLNCNEKTHAAFCKLIRSELFKEGFRSRPGESVAPDGADIIYPKYNTAVFVADCFKYGHTCCLDMLKNETEAFWSVWQKERYMALKEKQQAAQYDGWQTYIVWTCELKDPTSAFLAIQSIKETLRKNLQSGRHKDVGCVE